MSLPDHTVEAGAQIATELVPPETKEQLFIPLSWASHWLWFVAWDGGGNHPSEPAPL